MNRVGMLMASARTWWQGRASRGRLASLAPEAEKTLRELMAEQGLDENGRKLESTGAQRAAVICSVEFSYDCANGSPGHTVLKVVRLDAKAFHGFSPQTGEMLSFPWSRVRGLMRLVDSGEMLEPKDVIAQYC